MQTNHFTTRVILPVIGWLVVAGTVILPAWAGKTMLDISYFPIVSEQQSVAKQCSFTVVPPGPVTDKVDIEARLAVFNNSDAARDFSVAFHWVSAGGDEPIATGHVSVPPRKVALVRTWAPTAQHVGANEVVFRLTDESGNVQQGRWPLQVVACDTPAIASRRVD